MAVKTPLEPFLRGDTGRNTRSLLRIIILCTIATAAIASRLFSVIRKLYYHLIYTSDFEPPLIQCLDQDLRVSFMNVRFPAHLLAIAIFADST